MAAAPPVTANEREKAPFYAKEDVCYAGGLRADSVRRASVRGATAGPCYNSDSLALSPTLSHRARGLISEHIRPRRNEVNDRGIGSAAVVFLRSAFND